MFEELKKISTAALRGRSIPVAVLLVLVVLLSVGSGFYAGASFFPQQAPNVTVTTTFFTTTTSWATSTSWSTVTSVVYGVWTTVQYTTSTSTVTISGGDTYTKLLLHMDGTGGSTVFLDSSPQLHTITANGNAQIDMAQSEFGGTSGRFDGNGAYLSAADSADWAFGTGDFTIDFWVRFSSLTNEQMIVSQLADASNNWYVEKLSNANGNKLAFAFYLGGILKGLYTMANNWSGIATNTWYHLAFARSGSSGLIFIDGVSQTLTQGTAFGTNDVGDLAAVLKLGMWDYRGYPFYLNGWLDEVRISKGVARWTTNFTPPTAPY